MRVVPRASKTHRGLRAKAGNTLALSLPGFGDIERGLRRQFGKSTDSMYAPTTMHSLRTPTELVAQSHGVLLRALSAQLPVAPQGLSIAARKFRGRLSPFMIRRLTHLDITFGVLRHISEHSCMSLQSETLGQLGHVAEGAGSASVESLTSITAPPSSRVAVDVRQMSWPEHVYIATPKASDFERDGFSPRQSQRGDGCVAAPRPQGQPAGQDPVGSARSATASPRGVEVASGERVLVLLRQRICESEAADPRAPPPHKQAPPPTASSGTGQAASATPPAARPPMMSPPPGPPPGTAQGSSIVTTPMEVDAATPMTKPRARLRARDERVASAVVVRYGQVREHPLFDLARLLLRLGAWVHMSNDAKARLHAKVTPDDAYRVPRRAAAQSFKVSRAAGPSWPDVLSKCRGPSFLRLERLRRLRVLHWDLAHRELAPQTRSPLASRRPCRTMRTAAASPGAANRQRSLQRRRVAHDRLADLSRRWCTVVARHRRQLLCRSERAAMGRRGRSRWPSLRRSWLRPPPAECRSSGRCSLPPRRRWPSRFLRASCRSPV